jgi:hypothetical protein
VAESEVVHHVAQSVKKAGFSVYRAFYESQFLYHRKHAAPPVWVAMRLLSWVNLGKRYALYLGSQAKQALRARGVRV